MSQLWVPVVIVVVIGLIAGLGLAIASILLAVPKDEKAEAIEEMLPGANCGACGFSGCSGYAKALAHGEAKPGLCAPGGAEVAKTVSQYLGLADVAVEAKISDWKAGLEQAARYKQYANEVYVALSSEYVSKVDKQQFKDLNIGLMSVSSGKLKISIRARKQPVEKLDIQYYIADRFLKQLKLSETL